MGIYDKAGEAQFSEGGNYLNAGFRYLLEQMKFEARYSRKGDPITVTEWRVHESDDPKIRLGAIASWVPNMKHELSLGNVMCCVAALSGIDPSDKNNVKAQVTTAVLEYCASLAAQPLKGKMVEVTTQNIKTKERGQDFTKHLWQVTNKPPNQAVLRGEIAAPPAGAAVPTGLPVAPPGAMPGAPPAMPNGGGYYPPAAPPALPAAPPAAPAWTLGAPPALPAIPGALPVAPPVPPVPPAPRWVTHPQNPAYEWLEGTDKTRLRGA